MASENIKSPTPQELNAWYKIANLENGIYAIQEPYHDENVFCYLIKGQSADLLVDTGMAVKPLKPAIGHLLEEGKELFVINTHGHFDHIGGNSEFPDVFSPVEGMDSQQIKDGWSLQAMNKYDVENRFIYGFPPDFYVKSFSIPTYTNLYEVLEEGVTFDLGDREIAVIHTPGHTWGSVSLLDTSHGILFSSDLVYQGPLYCFDYDTSYMEYVESLEKLRDFDITLIHPGHNYSQNSPQLISMSLELFKKAADPDIAPDSIEGTVLTYIHPDLKELKLLISKDKLPNLSR